MYTCWTQHIKDEETKENFKRQVVSAAPVLERLGELIDLEYKGLESAEQSTKVYDMPNWDYRMADGNGFKRACNFVKKLIDLDQQKDNK